MVLYLFGTLLYVRDLHTLMILLCELSLSSFFISHFAWLSMKYDLHFPLSCVVILLLQTIERICIEALPNFEERGNVQVVYPVNPRSSPEIGAPLAHPTQHRNLSVQGPPISQTNSSTRPRISSTTIWDTLQ